MKLYFIAGESSGDARAAEVMASARALSPGIAFHGLGGPRMKSFATEPFQDWIDRAGVIGFLDVIRHYPYFRRVFNETLNEIERLRPDAVVCIDYPGFNLRLVEAIRRRKLRTRVIYYISPQVWAWHRSRIPKMAASIDLMLCIFPFEKQLYELSGLRTEFVGHPLVDRLRSKVDAVPREDALVGLFPGSRRKEVAKIFPVLVQTASRLVRQHPELRFAASAASRPMASLMRDILAESKEPGAMEIVEGDSQSLMQRATVGIVASGTATLEAAVLRMPYLLVYKAAWLTGVVGRRVVKVPHLGIVNVLAGREVIREFVQETAEPEAMAAETARLLSDPAARESLVAEFDEVVAGLGGPGAADRAAEAILREADAPWIVNRS